jgi:BASS family bile acid:Na+ symporter
MTVDQFFEALLKLSGLIFVVSSMLAMGLSLTVSGIVEPLRDPVRVVLALVANFVLVPILALAIAKGFGLDQALQNGLIILATAAGAPFLPKLVQGAKGDIAFAVGLMVLLMVVTIVYLPIVLPILLPGVTVDSWSIAVSLIVVMLIPLAIGLLVKSTWPDDAIHWQPLFAKTSSLAILVLLVLGLGLNVSNILALIGTGGLVALLLFVLGSMVIGFALGGRQPADRSAMVLGTTFRNVAAALVVASGNFAGTATVPYILVGALILLLVTLPTAKILGRRQAAAAA